MESLKNHRARIILKNEPKLSDFAADSKFNERRIALAPHIQDWVSHHEMYENTLTHITFASGGVSSLVCILETPETKQVLKIPLSKDYSLGEGEFLNVWEKAGVTVPHVSEVGYLDGHQYTLMEYIDAPIVGKTYSDTQLLENNTYARLGETLRQMHQTPAKGYGKPIGLDGTAEFDTFTGWFDSADMQKRFSYNAEHHLVNDGLADIDRVRSIFIEHTNQSDQSSYCHDDYSIHHVFATDPLTVFDPNPRFNNGYIDLGRSLLLQLAHSDSQDAISQYTQGYFDTEDYNEQALHASIALAYYMKLPYWHKTQKGRESAMQRIVSYLQNNRKLLS